MSEWLRSRGYREPERSAEEVAAIEAEQVRLIELELSRLWAPAPVPLPDPASVDVPDKFFRKCEWLANLDYFAIRRAKTLEDVKALVRSA